MIHFFLFSLAGLIVLLLLIRLATLELWPMFEPTEGRYAETARQMLLTQDWLIPHVWIKAHLVPFLGKPPLYFWIAASSIWAFGEHVFSVRFASFFGMLLTVVFMLTLLRRYFSTQTTLRMILCTVSCGLLFGLSGTIGVDVLLSAFVSLAFLSYYAWIREEKFWKQQFFSTLFFIALGLGFMTKGAVILVTLGLPIFVWHCLFGQWGKVIFRHAWLFGSLVILLITVPWFYFAQIQMAKEGIDFIHYFFMEEHVNRFLTKDYFDPYGRGHRVLYGLATLMMLCATLPWGILALWFFRRLSPQEKRLSVHQNIFFLNSTEAFFFLGFAINTLFWCFARQFLITYFIPFTMPFCIWFVLRFEWKYPKNGVWFTRVGLLMAISFPIAFMAVTWGLFPWALTRHYIYEHFTDIEELEMFDQKYLPKGEYFKIVVFEPRNSSAAYFYGEPTGRLLMNKNVPFEISKKGRNILFHAKKTIALDQDLPIVDALKVYDQSDRVLYIVSTEYLEKPLGFQKNAIRWADLENNIISWSDDGKNLHLGKPDNSPYLEVIDHDKDYLLLRPVGLKKRSEFEQNCQSVLGDLKGAAVFYCPTKNQTIYFNLDSCLKRSPPCSTFKIFTTLLGLDGGFLESENTRLGYKGKTYLYPEWNHDVTLREAFMASCVWYYEKLVDKMDKSYVQKQLEQNHYGNTDLSAWNSDSHQTFWIESSLKISPLEQVHFLDTVFSGKSHFKKRAVELTKSFMQQPSIGDLLFYGKSGTGRNHQTKRLEGWFVGMVENRAGKVWYFALFAHHPKKDVLGRPIVTELVRTMIEKNKDFLFK